MNSLNYKHLRYFLEVARQGNLTRTARLLGVAQSALKNGWGIICSSGSGASWC